MKKTSHHVLKAASIGSVASELLTKDGEARVFGKTSRGIFIKTSGKWLFFLSFEKFRGPLTITLAEPDPIFRSLPNGSSLRIDSRSIFLPVLDAVITTEGSQIWQPRPPFALPSGSSMRREQLAYLANGIILQKNGVGLASLIPPLLGFPNTGQPYEIMNPIGWADIQQIQYYIVHREAAPLGELLSTILGAGSGLTPSADDFVVGLLLALNRWQKLLWKVDRLRYLNHQVVEAAYEKTTTLSANLIECAAHGLADERLVNALDWLMTGGSREPKILDDLLGWGNSSGVDVFVGMAIAICSD